MDSATSVPLDLRDGCLQRMQMEPEHVDQDVHTDIYL